MSHYADIIEGTPLKKLIRGYDECLIPIVVTTIQSIPDDERIEFVFEQQDRYAEATIALFEEIVRTDTNNDDLWQFSTPSGLPKIAKWDFVPKGSTIRLEPADYLLYSILQQFRDPSSTKAKWCESIRRDDPKHPWTGRVMSEKEIRGQMFRRERILNAIGRESVVNSPFAEYSWAFCLNCALPMFGITESIRQSGSYTCGSCYALNIFEESIQPTRSDPQPLGRNFFENNRNKGSGTASSPSPKMLSD